MVDTGFVGDTVLVDAVAKIETVVAAVGVVVVVVVVVVVAVGSAAAGASCKMLILR